MSFILGFLEPDSNQGSHTDSLTQKKLSPQEHFNLCYTLVMH